MANAKKRRCMRTRSIHAGERPDPTTHASAPNLVMSTTYVIHDASAQFSAKGLGEDAPFVYTRWGNPTVRQLEEKIADLESAEACVAFGSGMAAVLALFLHLLKSGDRIVVSDVAYAGVAELARDTLPRLGIAVDTADFSDLDALRAAVRPGTRLVYAETPANPILKITDLRAAAEIARRAGALLCVDSTFATPVATRPIELGADLVLHSLTKYMGGHGDAIGGSLAGKRELIEALRTDTGIHGGGILSPFNAWLILRGIATLPIRMAAHADSALKVARFLEGRKGVAKVIYPGLPSHPQHDLARRQMENFSGMLAFRPAEGRAAAQKLADRLKVIHYAVSLGHHRSLIFYIDTNEIQENSFRLTPRQLERYREFAGDGIFRMSVGLEDPEDLCEDLDQALEA